MLDVDFEFRYRASRGDSSPPGVVCRWQDPIAEPRVTVLLGASGSGKTTVLRCLAGLERPERGRIRFGDRVWFDASARVHVPPHRRNVGVLFQDYALFPHLTVAGNIAFGAAETSRAAAARRAEELAGVFQLRGLEARLPRELSGGQQQRVALARAVFRRPQLLLLDEPLSALDRPTRDELREDLRSLIRELATPVYLVSHDRVDALTLADRTIVLDGGRVVQAGPTHEVFEHPATAAVARLVGVDTILLGRITAVRDGLARIEVEGRDVWAEAPAAAGHEAALCIRAEDVAIARHDAVDSSAMNRWRGVVRSEAREGPFVRVSLDCGFHVSALVTRDAWQRLGLKPGDEAWAVAKAASIRSLPRS